MLILKSKRAKDSLLKQRNNNKNKRNIIRVMKIRKKEMRILKKYISVENKFINIFRMIFLLQ